MAVDPNAALPTERKKRNQLLQVHSASHQQESLERFWNLLAKKSEVILSFYEGPKRNRIVLATLSNSVVHK